MPSAEKAVMYVPGARFRYGEPTEPDGREPLLFEYRIDGHSLVSREATEEDKTQYPSEYADFLERPKVAAEEAKQAAKDADDLAKKVAATAADDKKAAADKAKKAADEEDAKKASKTTVNHTTVKK